MLDTHRKQGLSLVEVIIAIGVFAFAMVTLIGLLGKTLTSISDSLSSEESAAVISKVETFMQSYDFDPSVTRFEEVYAELSSNGYIQLFVYTDIDGNTVLVEGSQSTQIDSAMTNGAIGDNVDGALYLALVTPSLSNPQNTVAASPSALPSPFDGVFGHSLIPAYASFTLGYLVMDVRIYQYDAPAPGQAIATLVTSNPPTQAGELVKFRSVLNF